MSLEYTIASSLSTQNLAEWTVRTYGSVIFRQNRWSALGTDTSVPTPSRVEINEGLGWGSRGPLNYWSLRPGPGTDMLHEFPFTGKRSRQKRLIVLQNIWPYRKSFEITPTIIGWTLVQLLFCVLARMTVYAWSLTKFVLFVFFPNTQHNAFEEAITHYNTLQPSRLCAVTIPNCLFVRFLEIVPDRGRPGQISQRICTRPSHQRAIWSKTLRICLFQYQRKQLPNFRGREQRLTERRAGEITIHLNLLPNPIPT